MGKTPDNTSPHELYRAAVAFHDMTKLPVLHIKPFGEDQPAVYLGYYANLSFAVELYLKAFLKDKTGKDVSEFGHNLDKLLREAMEQGFSFEQENITRLVEILQQSIFLFQDNFLKNLISPLQNLNEKIEFLGDRVLGLIIAKKLLELYPEEREGVLDKKFASLVNKRKCLE